MRVNIQKTILGRYITTITKWVITTKIETGNISKA
jgi:hypothetical protein